MLQLIHANPYNNWQNSNENGADFVFRDYKFGSAFMNDVAYLYYSERVWMIDVMKLIFYTIVRCDWDILDFAIVIKGPYQSDDHDYDY
jgi:hypothetical protein